MSILLILLCWFVVALGLFMAAGTLLSLSHHSHWFIRGWDFPRPIIAALALLSGGTYAALFFTGTPLDWGFLGAVGLCTAWQCYRIFPYTPLASSTVQIADWPEGDSTLRLLASNVEMNNTRYDDWLQMARRVDADIILALEVNDEWRRKLDALRADYPYHVHQPQDNHYGMVLLSRLKLIDPTVRFIVQDDVPSIHTGVELRNGKRIFLHGVHPRPPEPIRDQNSTARDAEVVIIGREIDEYEEHRPTIIAGDFNDVAWSHTTELFTQLSGLLDPRRGRGLYNTFHARYPLFRFPLDHVFHSNDFNLINLEVLEYVGSDHFPVLIELSYEPMAPVEQPEPEADSEDEEEAENKIEKAAEEEDCDELRDAADAPS